MNQSPNIVDDLGDWTWLKEMFSFFGPSKGVKFLGYCFILGAVWRAGETKPVAVERLIKFGLSRATAYNALADLEAFKLHLEGILKARVTEGEIFEHFRREDLSKALD